MSLAHPLERADVAPLDPVTIAILRPMDTALVKRRAGRASTDRVDRRATWAHRVRQEWCTNL